MICGSHASAKHNLSDGTQQVRSGLSQSYKIEDETTSGMPD